jgi:hypothetical protein
MKLLFLFLSECECKCEYGHVNMYDIQPKVFFTRLSRLSC